MCDVKLEKQEYQPYDDADEGLAQVIDAHRRQGAAGSQLSESSK